MINNENYLTGTVLFVNLERNFGFIQGNVNTAFQKYFFHTTRIVKCECDPKDIKAGMFARFIVSEIPPKKAGDAPYIASVELYYRDPSIDVAAAALAGGAK